MRRLAQAPPTPFIDGRKSVASRAHANMHATTNGGRNPRSGSSLPRRTIALGYSPRPCAGSRKHRRPRLSMVENRSRRAPTPTCMQRPMGAEILRSGKRPAPPRHRSRLLPQTVRQLAQAPPTPFIDVSKIGRVARPHQYACNDRGGRNPRSGSSLPRRTIALGYSPRPSAGSRKHRRPHLSMVENRSRRAPTPICMQRPRGPKS
jgi:hypothetical protein